jgi:hypothetical protein
MKELREDGRIKFVFAGGGPRRAALEESGAEFRPYCERGRLAESLGGCHIGLVTQKPATLGCVVPSKTYALMAAGRAVLFIGPRAATPARIIERFGCGWQVECGDVAGLCGLLDHLAGHLEEVEEAGRLAREAFLAEYDFSRAFERFRGALGIDGRGAEVAEA